MQGLSDVFGELFARAGSRTASAERSPRGGPVISLQPELPPSETTVERQLPPAEQSGAQASDERVRLLRIFNRDGDTLELSDNRLKARSARDYYTRLTYLFSYAQEILLGRTAPRSELDIVLKAAKVYDANCRHWLKQKKGFTVSGDDDRIKLNASAREDAIRFLNETLDQNVADAWNPDKKGSRPRATKKSKKNS